MRWMWCDVQHPTTSVRLFRTIIILTIIPSSPPSRCCNLHQQGAAYAVTSRHLLHFAKDWDGLQWNGKRRKPEPGSASTLFMMRMYHITFVKMTVCQQLPRREWVTGREKKERMKTPSFHSYYPCSFIIIHIISNHIISVWLTISYHFSNV